MGFSGTDCAKNLINWDDTKTNLFFQCQGTTHIGDVVGGVGMNHDNIITTCFVNEAQEAHDTVGFNDMANFDYDGFKSSIMTQCGG